MKKIVVISLLFFPVLFLFKTSTASATQGACSYHGGVNCSAGADWDGSAVCNDGWRGSTELYSQMKECEVGRHYCSPAELSQLELKYDVAGKKKVMSDLNDQLLRLNDQSRTLAGAVQNNPSISDLRSNQIQQSEIATQSLAISSRFYVAQSDYWNASNQIDKECYALGDERYYQSQADFYKQLQLQTQNTCPENSTLTGAKCTCNTGFIAGASGDGCISGKSYCNVKFGPYAVFNPNTQACQCSAGYEWNNEKNYCRIPQLIQQPMIPIIEPKQKNEIKPAQNQPIQEIKKVSPKTEEAERINTQSDLDIKPIKEDEIVESYVDNKIIPENPLPVTKKYNWLQRTFARLFGWLK